jgi:modulator of FtsH protease
MAPMDPMISRRVLSSQKLESVLATNVVLRNTYILLGLTMLFSAFTAAMAILSNSPPLNPLVTLVGYMGLLFLTNGTRNSGWGLLSVFALTGFMGYTLGPILNYYIHGFINGQALVMMSLGGTGLIFFALSAYALITQKDFSFMGGFLMVGMLIALFASLANLYFHIPLLMLSVSAMFVLLSSGVILFQTSQIIHGGETNYITATVTLYVSLYNLFLSLLNLLGAFSGDRK